MKIVERYLSGLVKIHEKYPFSTDGDIWYQMACRLLKLKPHFDSPYEKCLIERPIQYVKDRNKWFDDYFLTIKKNYKLKHDPNWLNFFMGHYNSELIVVR